MNNAKDYLLQIRLLDAKLNTVTSNIDKIRQQLKELGDVDLSSSWPDGQPHGTITTDPTGSKAVQLATKYQQKHDDLIRQLEEYEYELIQVRSTLWSKRMEILDVISQVPDPLCHRLLVLRYVECRKWEWIAVELDKTYQWVAGPLHGRALVLVEDILEQNRIT